MGLVELYQTGGPVMMFILACSILALAVFLERLYYLRSSYHLPEDTLTRLRDVSAENLSSLQDHLRVSKNPFHELLLTFFEIKGLPPTEIKDRLASQMTQTRSLFERYSDILATIASISPLLGLLGTVLGMMHVFQTINNQGLGNPSLLAGGISEALITTIAGLLVAIPTFIAYKIVTARAAYLCERIEKQLNATYEKLSHPSPKKHA